MNEPLKVLDLFSGIGGFSLGLERAGMRTVAFCEIEPYCRAVLRKHWPNVPIYEDVRTLTADRLRADGIIPDVICGGFPCQDISFAGKGLGIEGERSGLWSHYARIISEVRPRYVIVENVAALLSRGLHRVLGDLAALGFDAEWHCIPASAIGAPHRRDRIWIVANPGIGRCHEPGGRQIQQPWRTQAISASEALADAEGKRRRPGFCGHQTGQEPVAANGGALPHPTHYAAIGQGIRRGDTTGQWWAEPNVGRVAHGVPDRVDRLECLGNAVVPQIPELIGRAILQAESEMTSSKPPSNEMSTTMSDLPPDIRAIEERAKNEDKFELWRHTTIERHLQAHVDRATLLEYSRSLSAKIAEMEARIAELLSDLQKAVSAPHVKDPEPGYDHIWRPDCPACNFRVAVQSIIMNVAADNTPPPATKAKKVTP